MLIVLNPKAKDTRNYLSRPCILSVKLSSQSPEINAIKYSSNSHCRREPRTETI